MKKNAYQIRVRLDCVNRLRGHGTSKPKSVLHRVLNLFLWGIIACVSYICITHDGRLADQLGGMPLGNWFDVRQYVAAIVYAGLISVAQFFVLGCLLYCVYHVRKMRTENDVFSIRRWPVVLVGLGLTVVLCGLRMGQLPDAIAIPIVFAFCGYVLGVWVTSNCLRGVRTTIWLVPKFCVLAIVIQILGGIVFSLATSEKSLAFEPRPVSADEKATLARLLKANEHLANDNHRLNLTERDVHLLLALACENLPADVKANARLREGTVELDVSLRLPLGSPFDRHVNSQGVYQFEIQEGKVAFRPLELRIGRLKIPAMLLGSIGNYVVDKVNFDSKADALISAVERFQFSQRHVEVVYHEKRLRQGSKQAFYSLFGETQEVVHATSAHTRHLVDFITEATGPDERFSTFLNSAFAFARERSLKGKDPIMENRAAILALSIVLGHYKVETLVGDVTDNRVRRVAEKYRGKVTLRGRRDWTRHFFVSAGLAIIFDAVVSDGAGLFKEEIDSAEGGSGFSFADLLADRAGVRFAVAATRDREAATRMQRLLADRFSVDDLFPIASDLPESLPAIAIEQEFGGVNGIVYKQVLADIERRLEACPLLTNK